MADLWIIRRISTDDGPLPHGNGAGMVREYEVSDAGRALMLHLPHQIKAPLVGFEAFPRIQQGRRFFPGFFFRGGKKAGEPEGKMIRVHEAQLFGDLDFSEYPELTDYIKTFRSALSRRSPVLTELTNLDPAAIETIHGLYAAPDGTVQTLSLAGSVSEQRAFVEESFGKLVDIRIDPADSYESNIAFKLDRKLLQGYRPRNVYQAEVKTRPNQRHDVHVLNRRKSLFRMEDTDVIPRLQKLQHAVELDTRLRDALWDCVTGKAIPHKLTAKSFHIGQGFEQVNAPLSLDADFDRHRIPRMDRERIIRRLSGNLLLCILSYRNGIVDNNTEPMRTVGVVMHNVSGIAGIEREFPELIRSIRSRASRSQLGEFYLFSEFVSESDARTVPADNSLPPGQGKSP